MMQTFPFQFSRFDDDHYLLVNETGEYVFLEEYDFKSFVNGTIDSNSLKFHELKSKHFVSTGQLKAALELVSAKYRSRKRFLSDFTALHMMVITLRCSNDCTYCQVKAEGEEEKKFDMSLEAARATVDCIFKSPSQVIKIEFQGGEPLLNWDVLKEAVLYAEKLNLSHQKYLDFVVCTNLVYVTDEQLFFFREHNVHISTSLDGPKDIHDKNRMLKNKGGTYDLFVKNLKRARNVLGDDRINALMTTTIDNIDRLDEVIYEYVDRGFRGVFIRPLNPYGLAAENEASLGYSIEYFVEKYKEAVDLILKINLDGVRFIEFFAELILSRIFTPFSTGFVDLQSPSGAGISGVIYDYNGNVYPADEGRMLSRMGDDRFLMGNVFFDTYESIFGGEILYEIVNKSCVDIMPYCESCVYKVYCGADPIRNYCETGDLIGRRPDNDFCKKNKLIFEFLFQKIKRNNTDEMDVLWSWVSRKSLKAIRGEEESS